MTNPYVIDDEQLGSLLVRADARARRLTFRTKPDGIHVTVPPGTPLAEVKRAIEQLRPRLLVARQKLARPLIDLNFRIDADYFRLTLVTGRQERFLSRSGVGEMQIVCPPDADFADEALQAWLRKVIDEALRRNAKVVLPPRLQQLGARHGLTYSSVKINSSCGRWGSCSARGSINLSFYLLLLPSDRLCAAARTGPYARDESRPPFLGVAGQDDRRAGAGLASGAAPISHGALRPWPVGWAVYSCDSSFTSSPSFSKR